MATPPRQRHFVVLNDAPVGDGTDDDLLEVTQVARGLADLIVASRGAAPFTLAVDGAWGMGKSSLMHRLEATLAHEPGVSAVWFNAWTSGRASALEGLIKSVLLRFDRNVLRRALRSMSRRAHLFGVVRGAGLALASFFGVGRVVDEMWQRMSLDAQARNEIKGVLRDAFGAWLAKGGSAGGGRLLVVFVDDLDRCASPPASPNRRPRSSTSRRSSRSATASRSLRWNRRPAWWTVTWPARTPAGCSASR
ncbi:P-loop NTPase fold protein [Amycolatopsis sp. cg9]|uniref:KAP family P-loop NTPase fold protein n=1 Tax=Amycolatopsis sp. cg9 TaxID=3238801 RepID=UPI0035258197